MKEKLAQFISSHGIKHWSRCARKDKEFVAWVLDATSAYEGLSFPEQVYVACTGDLPICEKGKRKTFNTIEKGWRYCGRAAKCACAREAVSSSMKATLATRTTLEQLDINTKRAKTNLQKYGVENIGQSEIAKAKHSEFYSDIEKINSAVEKGKATMLSTYGVDNAFKLPKVNEIRKTIAGNLTEEAKANRRALQAEYRSSGRYIDSSYGKLVAKFDRLGYNFLTSRSEYTGVHGVGGREKYRFGCKKCGNRFQSYIYDGSLPKCEHCFPPPLAAYTSREEAAIGDLIESFGVKIIRRSRGVLGGVELDIYVPELSIAIEYCGLYWHSQYASIRRGDNSPKDRECHVRKQRLCDVRGIRLITIFSDEWNQNRTVVENRLRHLFHKSSKRLYARNTDCKKIDHRSASEFLEARHTQGAGIPAEVRYGLYYDSVLVAVMTFGKPRRSNNQEAKEGRWELYRFASEGAVVGGASKMFKAFLHDHAPLEVRTFADRRWGDGKVYEAMGFVPDGESAPAYWYVEKYTNRYNRYNFTKHSLVKKGFDPALSESEIMRERGYDIIWDCGNMKYIWSPPE